MGEHVCEWRKWHPWCATYRCVHPRCYKNMPSDEVERHLNEHATLKREKHQYFLALRDIADTSPNWMQKDAVGDSEKRMRKIAVDALLKGKEQDDDKND